MFEFVSQKINQLNELIGRGVAWLVVVMVVLTFYDVLMRYLFQSGSIALQELEWHLFSVILLIGAAYTLKHRNHVRVDLIYASNRLSDQHRAIIDLFGHIFLLIPFCALIIWSSIPFIETAYLANEHSPDPGGLPHRWLLKFMIPLGFTLLALQALAEAISIMQKLIRGEL